VEAAAKTETFPERPATLAYEPRPAYAQFADPSLAPCQGKRIGILVVTYNALSTLVSVLKRIPPEVWNNVEEVLVFDDASRDSTFELALGIKAAFHVPKLRVLKHPKNLGYGGNQKAGYRYFIEKGFDLVVLLHGDGQYAPEFLAHMYHPIVAGETDAVFGSRMMPNYGGPLKGGMPFYKLVGNRILTTIENRALGTHLTEFHSGYRAYNLHALAKLDFSQMTDDFHFDTEIIIKLHHQGMKLCEVPIPTWYGTELCNVDGLKYARDVVRAVWRYKQTCRSVWPAPEFAEYFVAYPVKQSKHSNYYYARNFAGRGQEVLEIGCRQGGFSAELKEADNRVTGVDSVQPPPPDGVLERYIPLNLDARGALSRELDGSRFDRVLLLDVLEHRIHPELLLNEVRAALKEHGMVVVSLPNVANITVRLKLLFGTFNRTDRGVLDATHLHFFTRKTARRLLEQNGYEIVSVRPTVMPIELVLGLAPDNPLMRIVNACSWFFTTLLPGLLAYEFVFLVRPSRGQ